VLSEAGLVLVGSTLVVCLLFLPIVVHPGSTVIGPDSDAGGTIDWLWQLQQGTGYHLFGTTHNTLTGAPFGWEESNGLNIQWLLPYYPAYLATKVVGAIAAYNVILLAGFVLSGASMYLLVRYLGCGRLVSAWAGFAYIVFPWHLSRTPHASLVHLEFLPLLLLALVTAARKPEWPRFLLVGLAVLGCWLTSGYIGVMGTVAAVAFAVCVAFALPRRRTLFVVGVSGCALAASALVAFLSIVSGVGRGVGLERAASDLSTYGLRALELVTPSSGNLLLGDRAGRLLGLTLHGSNPTETSNYLGLLTIGLALAWLVVAWRSRKTLASRYRAVALGFTSVVVVALVLAAPSPIAIGGRSFWMPSRLLWEVIPAIRVPSRWVALAMTALVPLAALGLQAAWVKLERRGRTRVAPVALVIVAVLFSFGELAIDPASPRIRVKPLPTEYAAIPKTEPGILAEYPLVESNDYLLWQHLHGRPLLNGPQTFPAEDVRRVLVDPAVPGTASSLSLLGVTAMVTHANALDYLKDVLDVPDVPNASWGPGYSLVARSPDGSSLWRVVAPPAAALVTFRGGFGDPTPPRGAFVGYPLISGSGVGALELTAKKPGVVRLSFDAVPPSGQRKVLRVADTSNERSYDLAGRTTISVLVQVPRGHSVVLLKTDPPPQSAEDAILTTAPQAESASGEADLQAEQISSDPGF
jgi:hypothetical protein